MWRPGNKASMTSLTHPISLRVEVAVTNLIVSPNSSPGKKSLSSFFLLCTESSRSAFCEGLSADTEVPDSCETLLLRAPGAAHPAALAQDMVKGEFETDQINASFPAQSINGHLRKVVLCLF